MVLVDVTRMHIPFMTPDEALNSVSHAPVINFLAPNLVGILFRVCELLHELWRPECSFVETAAQELGGHNSDYVSHNSLSLFSPVSKTATRLVCMPYSRSKRILIVQKLERYWLIFSSLCQKDQKKLSFQYFQKSV